MSTRKTALFVDGNALMHRSFHAVKFNPTYKDQPVGMVYGMGSALMQSLMAFQPDVIVYGFDTKEKTFRHDMDDAYKAHRQKAPDEFYAQLPMIDELLEAFDIPIIKAPGFEADDIVGTLAVQFAQREFKSIIMSNDMDYCQLLGDHVQLCRPQGQITPDSLFTPEEAEAKMGVKIHQIIDFKAITGDSSDNYKGIDGVGPKGAATLLKQFESLEGIYQNLEKISKKVRLKFESQRDYAFHCQSLAKIKTDVALPFEIPSHTPINYRGGSDFFSRIQFASLAKRAEKMNNKNDQEFFIETKSSSKKTEEESQMSLF
ncbi:MAG TPA: 5'-3' exonuclease H3TH domain-containing protein [Candidatus Gracilibacteria bacterium]